MKKLLTFSAALLASLSMSADPVDLQKAKQLAAGLSVNEPVLVSTAARTEAKARKLSAQVQETAPYYVFSRGEGQGFVIVSGDDCLPTILGYTESGDFDEERLPPHLLTWLDYYKGLVEDVQAAGENVSRESPSRRNAPRHIKGLADIPALLSTHWHQTSPYNDRCPNISGTGNRCVTGCVATAAAQVVYFYHKDNPDAFLANTPTYGSDQWHREAVTDQIAKGSPIKWDLMLNSYGGSEPAEFRTSVADLVYSLGAMVHMDYGSSSAAQVSDLVGPFSTYFNLSGECIYKSEDSGSWIALETWERMIYDDLAAGHPIVYTGYHADQGGHAVVLDGYQSSTGLFHFNFGWGGQGDGWYTVDDETGMNYFKSWQGMVYKVAPKKQNLEGTIMLPKGFYSGITNPVTVKVKNLGTLDYSGVYLFCSTSSSKPSALSSAASKDVETILSADGSEVEFAFTARPTSSRAYTLTLTDASLNVLATMKVTPESAPSGLHLRALSVDAGTEVETLDGESYQVVYNTSSVAHATIENTSAIGYEGSTRLYLSVYDPETKAWTPADYKIGRFTVEGNAMAEASYTLSGLETGKYYVGRLSKGVGSSVNDDIDNGELADTVVRFILKAGDMEVVDYADNCLTLKGHFDLTAFNSTSFAGGRLYKNATVYDLTQCTNIGKVRQEVNPNALVYVADDSEATGANVVKAGKCAVLSLTPGYDFTPRAGFVAAEARLTLAVEPATWCLLTSPFDAVVPDGIIAREVLTHTKSGGIRKGTADVKTLEAGKTYLVMSSWAGNMTLTGENAKVVAGPVENTDAAVVGTYVNTTTPAGAQLVNNEEKQYFVPVEEGTAVEALRGYWLANDLTSTFRAFSDNSLDPAYRTLAVDIDEAHQILEKYRDIVTHAAYRSYQAQIQEAEQAFSNREDTVSLTTPTKVNRYAEELLAAGSAYSQQIYDVGTMEVDFTDKIVNSSFEARTGTPTGWTLGTKEGYTSVGSVVTGTGANNNRAVGLDGNNVFQSLVAKADSSSVRLSQVVQGLTPGYYRLTAMVGTDPDATVTLFAGDSTATVSGHAFGHFYLTKAVIDRIPVEADEDGDTGTLEIGIEEGRWYKADAFTLTYVGSFAQEEDPTAIEEVAAPAIATAPKKGIYTLQGVKVTHITRPGIYIIDGKKVVR